MWTLKTHDFPTPLLFGAAAVVLTLLVGWWHKTKRTNSPPRKWRRVGELSELTLFPVKSFAGINLQEAECTEYGIQTVSDGPMKLRDRFFIVYNEQTKEFKTARTCPKMVLVNVSLDGTDAVKLSAPDMPELRVKVPQASESNKHAHLKFWFDDVVETVDCGDKAAQWLSKYLLNQDCGVRLGYHLVDPAPRMIALKKFTQCYKTFRKSDLGAYSDLCSFMLMTESSVNDLKTKTSSDVSVVPRQFRPNFLVSGTIPYEEDKWEWIRIGETAVFRNVKPCTRCLFTTLNPVTAVMDPKQEPLRTLRGYRKIADPVVREVEGNSPAFGIYLGLYNTGTIRVGDSVFVGDE